MNATRRLFDVPLRPVIGSRFMPTGFPDVGAAEFDRPRADGDGTERCLLVESEQSMANHLEAAAWDAGASAPRRPFDRLPWICVVAADDGRYLTSSRTESHRVASAFVKHAELDGRSMRDVIRERLGLKDDTPLAARHIAAAVFDLDPMCLVHGVFFAESAKVWPGQPKISRALTGFVEAIDISRAIAGGVKRESVLHSVAEREGETAKEGYGSVPFHREEYTARTITASFCLDLAQLAAYGLSPERTELLEVAALWEVRGLLDGGMRLRTNCDLERIEDRVVDRRGEPLASMDELTQRLDDLAGRCDIDPGGVPLTVAWSKKAKA